MSANQSSHAADEAAIRSVLSSYQDALNASNTDAVMPLYPEDGVFMPPNNPSAVGKGAVRQAYDAVFKAITCPSSNALRQSAAIWNGGSGSFGFEIRRLSTDVAIVAV